MSSNQEFQKQLLMLDGLTPEKARQDLKVLRDRKNQDLRRRSRLKWTAIALWGVFLICPATIAYMHNREDVEHTQTGNGQKRTVRLGARQSSNYPYEADPRLIVGLRLLQYSSFAFAFWGTVYLWRERVKKHKDFVSRELERSIDELDRIKQR